MYTIYQAAGAMHNCGSIVMVAGIFYVCLVTAIVEVFGESTKAQWQ